MTRNRGRMVALGTGAVGMLSLILLLVGSPAAAGDDGKAVFLAAKCDMCHAVSTAGIEAKTKSESMRGPDLVDLAKTRDADWLSKYLKRQVKIEDEEHKKEFKGSDEELQAIVDWLLEQKSGS